MRVLIIEDGAAGEAEVPCLDVLMLLGKVDRELRGRFISVRDVPRPLRGFLILRE
jgi:hypothetical protein